MDSLGLILSNVTKIAPFILGVLDPDTLIAVITTYSKKSSKDMGNTKEQITLINSYREHVQKQIEYMTCALIAWSMAIIIRIFSTPGEIATNNDIMPYYIKVGSVDCQQFSIQFF